MRLLGAVIVMLILVGCGPKWVQEGKLPAETREDLAACADASMKDDGGIDYELGRRCMEEKGYQREE